MSKTLRDFHFDLPFESIVLRSYMLTTYKPVNDYRIHFAKFCLDTNTKYNDGYSRLGYAYSSAHYYTYKSAPTFVQTSKFCSSFYLAVLPSLSVLHEDISPLKLRQNAKQGFQTTVTHHSQCSDFTKPDCSPRKLDQVLESMEEFAVEQPHGPLPSPRALDHALNASGFHPVVHPRETHFIDERDELKNLESERVGSAQCAPSSIMRKSVSLDHSIISSINHKQKRENESEQQQQYEASDSADKLPLSESISVQNSVGDDYHYTESEVREQIKQEKLERYKKESRKKSRSSSSETSALTHNQKQSLLLFGDPNHVRKIRAKEEEDRKRKAASSSSSVSVQGKPRNKKKAV
jgi:hypothetical protein